MKLYSALSDAELAALIGTDAAAYDEIYERYWPVLYRAAFNVLKDEDACLDVIQEVFIWFWEHRTSITVNSVKAYLLVAVKYKVANYIRNGKVRASFYERIPKIEVEDDFPDQALEIKELKAMINNFIYTLPERCQEVFQLSRIDNLSNKEIAMKLGITEKTVENQINKALKKLKPQFGKSTFLLTLLI
uniref:RNA polymerase sigma-70 factor n=1 Tax=Pedobacter schmidteae TaxID=2201271 RepID=UPI000EB0AAB7|nr:RNA polymerase sigma-70 factor [Pedobacter schmidteae]